MITYIADIGSNWRISDDPGTNWLNIDTMFQNLSKLNISYVKFQAWHTPSFVHQDHPAYDSYYRKYELNNQWYSDLVSLGSKYNIKVMFTPFDNVTLMELQGLGLPAWKIASSDATCHALIGNVCKLAEDIYISLGNTTYEEIRNLIKYLNDIKFGGNVCLLHCVSKYPMSIKDAGFARFKGIYNVIQSNAKYPSKYTLGWSSHATSKNASYLASMALARTATTFEFHVKSDEQPKSSPDYPHSLSVGDLAKVIDDINTTNTLLTTEPKLDLHEINWGRRNPFTGKRPTIEPKECNLSVE
jgi:sialic acid synthase SpsE